MPRATSYVPYNPGLDMGTIYLTEEAAYFLGGIYAADEHIGGNQKYWAAPVRYNPQYSTSVETAEHFDFVTRISSSVRGYTEMKELIKGTPLDSGKNRLPGFSTFFKETTLHDLNVEIPNLKAALDSSQRPVKRAFILGAFDGRGTPDVSAAKGVIRYLSLDCPTDEIGSFLSDVLTDFGLSINYNTARDRLEGGNPRKSQLRIKDVDKYMEEVGYISPAKFRHLEQVYRQIYTSVTVSADYSFLPGVKLMKGV